MIVRSPERPADGTKSLTLEQCDRVLTTCRKKLRVADGDPELQAICRYEVDRWLDIRLALMRAAA